jgi:uncharacterized membrane protein (DUF485 family)
MHLPQQAPLPIPIYRPPPTIHESHETGLSHAAVQKIQEFKLLMNILFFTGYYRLVLIKSFDHPRLKIYLCGYCRE